MTTLRLVGWKKGLRTVSLVEAVMRYSTGSLVASKQLIDELLDGREVVLSFPDEIGRDEFARLAEELGAVVG